MKRENYISDDAVVKRANEAVRLELEKQRLWIFLWSYMTEKSKSYIRKTAMEHI